MLFPKAITSLTLQYANYSAPSIFVFVSFLELPPLQMNTEFHTR